MIREASALPIEQQGGIVDAAISAALGIAVEERDAGRARDLGRPLRRGAVSRFGQPSHGIRADVVAGQEHLRQHQQARAGGGGVLRRLGHQGEMAVHLALAFRTLKHSDLHRDHPRTDVDGGTIAAGTWMIDGEKRAQTAPSSSTFLATRKHSRACGTPQ